MRRSANKNMIELDKAIETDQGHDSLTGNKTFEKTRWADSNGQWRVGKTEVATPPTPIKTHVEIRRQSINKS